MAGLLGLRQRSRDGYRSLGFAGFLLAELGLAVALIGNVIEFWVGGWIYVDVPGEFEPTDHLGWAVFLFGVALALLGVAIWAAASFARRVREKRRPPRR